MSEILPPLPQASAASGAPDTSRLANRENLEKAGRQFEAVFTRMMLKSMRQPKLADDIFGSKALDTFREMQDGQFADKMAEAKPMGIGRAVVEFLARSQPDLNDAGSKDVK
ncbi:rod-binding protein [Sphingomonas sp.]|uniref:rod-binding protein n=1 Tax=Sphingomonas sp. TaxID=28214 RepID=UPI001DCFEAD9|nr:rod-binding protein [Sphingomonas sp.]MBX9795379.1 rod-binding protein [Sphingomonas sp.]